MVGEVLRMGFLPKSMASFASYIPFFQDSIPEKKPDFRNVFIEFPISA
jgi:hypothetical protein